MSLTGCGCLKKGQACEAAGSARNPTAPRDTIFTRWETDAQADSGYNLVTVQAGGDTLSLYLQWIKDVNPHLRIWGPTAGPARSGGRRLWRHHRLEIQNPGEMFESSADVTTQGAGRTITGIALAKIVETPDSIWWEQCWQFGRTTGAGDTLDVERAVMMRRGQPYFLVRYRFTWRGQAQDSVRLIWSNHPRMGQGGSRYDVGFAPGFGLVTTQRVFDAAALNYWACMLDVGNPAAPGADTLGGAASFMSPELAFDAGSGRPDFAAAFVCFNGAAEMAPRELAWMDSQGSGEPSLDFDSPAIALDTTRVLGSGFRSLLARTPVLVFAPGETKTLEYAVGRGRIGGRMADGLPPAFPDVTWFDGSVSRCPAGR